MKYPKLNQRSADFENSLPAFFFELISVLAMMITFVLPKDAVTTASTLAKMIVTSMLLKHTYGCQSIHAGQDNSVHVTGASRAAMLAKTIAFRVARAKLKGIKLG